MESTIFKGQWWTRWELGVSEQRWISDNFNDGTAKINTDTFSYSWSSQWLFKGNINNLTVITGFQVKII